RGGPGRAAGAEGDPGGRGAERRRPDPPWPLRPRREHPEGVGRAHGRLRDPRGGARRARPVHHDDRRRRERGARHRERAARARRTVEPGEELTVFGPLGNGYRLDVERPLLVGGGIGVAPLPYLSRALRRPRALLGFRSDWHAEAAELVPNAEVAIEPTLVTE